MRQHTSKMPFRGARAVQRADRFMQQGRVHEAIEALRQALVAGADRVGCLLRLCRLYRSTGQLIEAAEAAERAVAEEPGARPPRAALLAVYLERKEYAQAIDVGQELVRLFPRYLPAHDALGAAYVGLGDMTSALRVAAQLIKLDPTDPTHYMKRGLLHLHRGEYMAAMADLETVVALAPSSPLAEDALTQIGLLDALQLNDILILATDDLAFRLALAQDASEAASRRGFRLSAEACEYLRCIVKCDDAAEGSDTGMHWYH